MNRYVTAYFITIFMIVLILNVYIFSPFFHSIALGAIFAGAYYPLYLNLLKKMSHVKATWITITIMIFSLVLPSIYMVIQISREALDLYYNIQNSLSHIGIKDFFFGNGPAALAISKFIKLTGLSLTLDDLYLMALDKAKGLSGQLIGVVNSWVSNTFHFIMQFIIMVICSFGFINYAKELKKFVFELSPLPDDQEQTLLNNFNQMNFATLVGNGLGGLIQGVVGGIALWMIGTPSVFLWTVVMIILAFIPLVGISVVTIPVAIITFLEGNQWQAIVFTIVTSLTAVYVENVLKPKFIGNRVKINSLLLLLYILSGMASLGFMGIFYGPLIGTMFLSLARLFKTWYFPKVTGVS